MEGGGDRTHPGLKSAELYDPNAGTWTPTGFPSTAHGGEHTAFLMPDSTVLVAGGLDETIHVTGVTEYYDIEGDWPLDPLASLNVGRVFHASALLPNGKVLVAGGWGGGLMTNNLTSAELYNPMDNTWSFTNSLNTARIHFSAVLLAHGTVLVAGGDNGNGVPLQTAEIYSPKYVWNPAGPPAYFAGTGHWYQAFTFSAAELDFCYNNWEFARVKAEAMGGYLATVTSEAENNFIYNLIKQDSLWHQWSPTDNQVSGPWLGGYQDYRMDAVLNQGLNYYVWKIGGGHVFASDAWKWVTGETWSYAKWLLYQPDDYPADPWPSSYERGHQNYLHYINNQYDPADPSSPKWAPTWEDATFDGWNYVQGFVVKWDQKPPVPGGAASPEYAAPGLEGFPAVTRGKRYKRFF